MSGLSSLRPSSRFRQQRLQHPFLRVFQTFGQKSLQKYSGMCLTWRLRRCLHAQLNTVRTLIVVFLGFFHLMKFSFLAIQKYKTVQYIKTNIQNSTIQQDKLVELTHCCAERYKNSVIMIITMLLVFFEKSKSFIDPFPAKVLVLLFSALSFQQLSWREVKLTRIVHLEKFAPHENA